MDKKQVEIFDGALYGVCERIAKALFLLPDSIKADVREIRMRTGKAVALTLSCGIRFLSVDSNVSTSPFGCVKADKKDLEESFRLICFRSVYSHLNEINNGFVIMRGGHRAGISGTFCGGGGVTFVSSLNLRIAREFFGAADFLKGRYGGLLIAGPPGSGKTTVLRDFIRSLSSGLYGEFYRVAVVDARGEISASFEGVAYNDLGENTDVLLGIEKGEGAEIAVRCLYPHFVAFDEIGNERELSGISNCISAGVNIITTAHVKDQNDLMKREITRRLLISGAIDTVAVLKTPAGSGSLLLSKDEVIKTCG